MNTTRTIIGELDRERTGERPDNPEALAQALEAKALQVHVETNVGKGRGETVKDLKELTTADLPAAPAGKAEGVPPPPPEEITQQLEQADAGQEVRDPDVLVQTLLERARAAREVMKGKPAGVEHPVAA